MKSLPSQTVGPFYHLGLTADPELGCLARPGVIGERIRVHFRMIDGDGAPVPDGLIEIWQADASGNYDQPPGSPFRGFGRLSTGADGVCTFETILPGRTADNQAPHINVSVFARGLLVRLCTRVYFELAEDSVLALVPADRRHTLIARRDSAQPCQWNFDIRLQGENETVFFDI